MAKPAEDPKVAEPAQPTLASKQPEAPENPAAHVHSDLPELSVDETVLSPCTTEPSSSGNPPDAHIDDILITWIGFVEPGNPTVLVKHSAKQEVLERQKVRFDISHYAHLSISDVLSGYLSHVHSNHDPEIQMVK